MAGEYAKGTSVPTSRSRDEIERTLQRFGADETLFYSRADRAVVQFTAHGRQVRFMLELPDPARFRLTPTGRERSEAAARDAWEQGCRESWRALAATIKAKLVAVEARIVTFEQEFMPYVLLSDGSTVAEHVLPAIAQNYATGELGPMLAIEHHHND